MSTMKFKIHIYLLLQILLVISAENCDYKSVGGEIGGEDCYKKELLLTVAHSPNQMTVHNYTLYFSFDIGNGEYSPATIHLETKKTSMLKGIKDAYAMTTDRDNGDIYFGGAYGIYKFKPAKKTLKKLAFKGLDIWWLMYHRDLYYIRFPSLNSYRYINKTIRPVKALEDTPVHQFVFDNRNNLIFINSTGLYGVKDGTNSVVLVQDEPKFYVVARDKYGIVHVCTDDGIFKVLGLRKAVKLIDIADVLGMTFDDENSIIYSDAHNLYRLITV